MITCKELILKEGDGEIRTFYDLQAEFSYSSSVSLLCLLSHWGNQGRRRGEGVEQRTFHLKGPLQPVGGVWGGRVTSLHGGVLQHICSRHGALSATGCSARAAHRLLCLFHVLL